MDLLCCSKQHSCVNSIIKPQLISFGEGIFYQKLRMCKCLAVIRAKSENVDLLDWDLLVYFFYLDTLSPSICAKAKVDSSRHDIVS
jgi:hypothetical protein